MLGQRSLPPRDRARDNKASDDENKVNMAVRTSISKAFETGNSKVVLRCAT